MNIDLNTPAAKFCGRRGNAHRLWDFRNLFNDRQKVYIDCSGLVEEEYIEKFAGNICVFKGRFMDVPIRIARRELYSISYLPAKCVDDTEGWIRLRVAPEGDQKY